MLPDNFAIDRYRSSCHVAVDELGFLFLPDVPCSSLGRDIVSRFSKVLPYWTWWRTSRFIRSVVNKLSYDVTPDFIN